MFRRQSRVAQLSGDGSELSLSQGSSKSKSLDSTEDLSKSSTLSSPEALSKRGGSLTSIRSSVVPTEQNDADFRVRIVGCIENIHGFGSGPLDVINLIDIAQQENELPLNVNEEAVMTLTVHGIKLTKYATNAVIYRIPIHLIERLVIFEDGLVGNTMLAVKCVRTKANPDGPFDIHAYQCENKEMAQEVCSRFNHILETAVSTTCPAKVANEPCTFSEKH